MPIIRLIRIELCVYQNTFEAINSPPKKYFLFREYFFSVQIGEIGYNIDILFIFLCYERRDS